MDSSIAAAVITAVATILAALITVLIVRRRREELRRLGNVPAALVTPTLDPDDSSENARISEQLNLTQENDLKLMGVKQRNTNEAPGIRHVLQEHLFNRITGQLDPSIRLYETSAAVDSGCKKLAAKIKEDRFKPEIIIGWRDTEGKYQGSQEIAKLLSYELGVESRVLLVEELAERREVTEDCQWFRNREKALIVDDACYSGRTLYTIWQKLSKENEDADIRLAVLTTCSPPPRKLRNLYYISTHTTDVLLFPWGWSWKTIGLYDIYSLFGISERHTVWCENINGVTICVIAKQFIGNIRLLNFPLNTEIHELPNRGYDTFLYLISGSLEIHIGEKNGTFNRDQYIFVPRLIGYRIRATADAEVLELSTVEH